MNKNLKEIKLSEICEIQSGYSFKSKNFNKENGYRVIRISNVQKGMIIDKRPIFINDIKNDYKRFRLKENDILVSLTGDVGRVGKINFNLLPAVLNQRVARLHKINSEKVDIDYLYHFLNSDFFEKKMIERSKGVAQLNLSPKEILESTIYLTSLNEQKRIVKKLDTCMEQIDKAIQNVEQNIKNAEELFQSYLNKILLSENDGWLMTSIGKVANIVNGGTPKTSIMDYWSGDILWITPKDMGKLDSIYVSDTSRKITELGLKKSSAKLLPKNSIILSSRAPIGHLAINTEPISTNQGCKGIVPGEQIESKFLYYFLLCNVKLLNDLGVGTTFKELSMSKLSNIEISLPERDIQQKIINEIDGIKIQTEQLKNNYQNELISLKELKKSILEKAFNGEL